MSYLKIRFDVLIAVIMKMIYCGVSTVLQKFTNVSEEHTAFIFKLEECHSQEDGIHKLF